MELFGQLIRRLFHKLGLENPDFLGRLGRVDNIFSQLISRNAGEFCELIEILFDGLSGKDPLQGLFELGGGLLGNVGQEGLLFLVVEEFGEVVGAVFVQYFQGLQVNGRVKHFDDFIVNGIVVPQDFELGNQPTLELVVLPPLEIVVQDLPQVIQPQIRVQLVLFVHMQVVHFILVDDHQLQRLVDLPTQRLLFLRTLVLVLVLLHQLLKNPSGFINQLLAIRLFRPSTLLRPQLQPLRHILVLDPAVLFGLKLGFNVAWLVQSLVLNLLPLLFVLGILIGIILLFILLCLWPPKDFVQLGQLALSLEDVAGSCWLGDDFLFPTATLGLIIYKIAIIVTVFVVLTHPFPGRLLRLHLLLKKQIIIGI